VCPTRPPGGRARIHVFPEADAPVIQLSIDAAKPPSYHLELGRRPGAGARCDPERGRTWARRRSLPPGRGRQIAPVGRQDNVAVREAAGLTADDDISDGRAVG
jgi:hypothetical protein